MISDYRGYTSRLRELLVSIVDSGLRDHHTDLLRVLDGQAAAELRDLVELPVRRARGAFFTTGKLRAMVLSSFDHSGTGVYFDPACGAGDLLVEAAMRMPVFDSYLSTVEYWGERLMGCDVEPVFVETAKLRLLLAAAYRSGQPPPQEIPEDVFPWVVVGDGLAQERLAKRSSHIVLNPPFGYMKAPDNIPWAGGRISEAAFFLARVIEYSPPGVSIAAVLPDVLRSGSRYGKWRSMVESMVEVTKIEIHGVFDESTDIDVFVLHGTKSDPATGAVPWVPEHEDTSVGNYFDVHVGAVVPHRDPETGPRHPYIWPRRLPLAGSFDPRGEWRRFSGTTFDPPFVAIRRTSRPGEKRRAGGVLVVGDWPVAVENHLLVAIPKDGSASSCLALIDTLADKRTRDWIDSQIRTRHLTVSVTRGIPWLGDNADG